MVVVNGEAELTVATRDLLGFCNVVLLLLPYVPT